MISYGLVVRERIFLREVEKHTKPSVSAYATQCERLCRGVDVADNDITDADAHEHHGDGEKQQYADRLHIANLRGRLA